MRNIYQEILLIVYVFIFLLILEAWHRSSITAVFTWGGAKSYVLFLNFLILLSLVYLIVFVTGRRRLSLWITSGFMLIFFTISRIKMNLKGEPLLPWDVFLGDEARNIGEYFVLMTWREFLIFALIVFVTITIPILFSRKIYEYKQRGLFFIVPLVVFSLLFFEKPISLLEIGEVNNVFWDQSITYQRNGVQVGFVNTLQLINIEPPDGYTRQRINELSAEFVADRVAETRPNIIIIMNEAFWDPMRLPKIEFSQDPLPFFRSLQTNHSYGELLVPVFGGSTANTEFEILTGNSMQFLPQGSIPYSQYVHNPHPSIASRLRNDGYKAIAIHNYHNWFYRRDQVYKHFGFDHFISQSFFKDPEYRRDFISDKEMSRRIITEHQNSDDPLFIFAVTMQNHGPYNARHYQEDRVFVKGISEDLTRMLNTYSTGVKDADESLELLVNYFEKINEPTVIVFFGDHLPYLGAAYRAYTETNYIGDANPDLWSKEEYEKMYSVPFVIWDNFSNEKHVDLRMSASFLTPLVLEKYTKPQTPLMIYLNEIFSRGSRVFTSRKDVSEIDADDVEQYMLLQYDQLFGEMYAYTNQEIDQISSSQYQLGSEQLQLNKAEIMDGVEPTLFLSGENFTYKTKIYINGDELPTIFHADDRLTAIVPAKYLKKDQNLNVKAAIKDSKNRVIATTETINVVIN